ncbi:carboxylate-amine ligase [Aquicoccus porphyridii]|uniref:Putative glutamate--cysteine ligase 2 n=1 Tax=Aquicoccus porphyridii TaxID=1852029 RepID=A0A5A9ZU07_9RHOB|nr:carboxylate-amine ligase [Aquicoccus porphyridii]KAA0920680.1 carboxylate-amine ligase [Aquicoccus porphyridii]RAI56767.1 carboxylate-amine ligase [Rhodobacteraceae bacterium AsT-22]
MASTEPAFSLGIEEEYLLVDRDSLDLSPAPEALMERCTAALEGQFSPEFLECQVEIGTKVCRDIGEAREDLKRLRATVAQEAAAFNLAPIAASCHPFSDWRDQQHTRKQRYDSLRDDLAGVVRRLLICGNHVHIGIDDRDRRVDLINQLKYFLPHLLALSCSSPFWQGEDTGLSCYRLTVFDNLPRTGLPPRLEAWGEFERSVSALVELDLIEDATKIWWDLRPSHKFPTIESRICDVSPRMETALTLAALTQSLTRMLWRLSQKNQRWRIYDNFLISENRWRAQRYGIDEGLIDFGANTIQPFSDSIDDILDLIAEDAGILGCTREVEHSRTILRDGTSANRQRAVHRGAVEAGQSRDDALRAVVQHLIEEYHADL